MQTINLEEILKKELIPIIFAHSPEMTFLATLRAMKEACQQTLILASENAKTEVVQMNICGSVRVVDKESILEIIRQIV